MEGTFISFNLPEIFSSPLWSISPTAGLIFLAFLSFFFPFTRPLGSAVLLCVFLLDAPGAVFNSVYRLLAAHRLMQIRLRNF